MNDNELLQLLKYGRGEEARIYFGSIQEQAYSEDFTHFIDEMIDLYGIKRKEIALRSGMSQDYTYKLLRGDKKTTERDYILAICIAIGMNYAQVQHALRIYGMPVLSNSDLRSHVIALGIQHGCDIDELNDWLEKADFYLLKTSPDMPSAPITPAVYDEQSGNISDVPPLNSASFRNTDQYEELDRRINAERCGDAPIDYSYWGVIKIRDEAGNVYYVEASYHPEGEHLDVLTEEMHDKYEAQANAYNKYIQELQEQYGEDLNDYEKMMADPAIQKALSKAPDPYHGITTVEEYDSFVDAAESPFFYWYLEIDKATDEKVQEVLSNLDDTRNFGIRHGAGFEHGCLRYYMEAFNTHEPEKREYFQIIQEGDNYTYSVSHESYFMRIEMGDIYPFYFGKKKQDPEYFIKVTDLNELDGNELRYRFIFSHLQLEMHEYAHEHYGMELNDGDLNNERITTLTQQATQYYHSEQYEEAAKALEEAYSLMKQLPDSNPEKLPMLIVTCTKLAHFYRELSQEDIVDQWYRECLKYEGELSVAMNNPALEGVLQDAPVGMAEAFLHESNRYRGNDVELTKSNLLKAINLYNGHCNSLASWGTYMGCLMSYAFYIDEEDPEKSLEYTRKALDIVRAHGFDHMPPYHTKVFTLLNNHAWVLWNRLSSEEAIIYYGQAIDLLEGYLAAGTPDAEAITRGLKKEARELVRIYQATNKTKEAERLTRRMTDKGYGDFMNDQN